MEQVLFQNITLENNYCPELMDEMTFEYHYDPTRKHCCLNCNHYFRFMKQYDAKQIAQVNGIKDPHKTGQKYCIFNKVFVFMSDACGYFREFKAY